MSNKGLFISLEGGEYVGKTSLVKMLNQELSKRGIPSISVRDPGGTIICEDIRTILKSPCLEALSSPTELFLFLASRAQLDNVIIKPSVDAGKVVIADRWLDSTVVYQGMYKKAVNEQFLLDIHSEIMKASVPNLTFLLDVPVEEILKRKNKRDINAVAETYDSKGAEFFQFLRDSYLEVAKRNPARIIVLDGTFPLEETVQRMIRYIYSELDDGTGKYSPNKV